MKEALSSHQREIAEERKKHRNEMKEALSSQKKGDNRRNKEA